ncbi:hypothetical protein GCM10028792_39480 [Salinisphaera aquimarina]
MGASGISFSRDSAYRYQLNSNNGTINAFGNNGDGALRARRWRGKANRSRCQLRRISRGYGSSGSWRKCGDRMFLASGKLGLAL